MRAGRPRSRVGIPLGRLVLMKQPPVAGISEPPIPGFPIIQRVWDRAYAQLRIRSPLNC